MDDSLIFDKRNSVKKNLTQRDMNFFVYKKEIWYVKLGKNVGFEQDGKKEFGRPVLVIKKIGNLYLCIPLTTKGKNNHPFYCQIKSIDFHKPSYLILTQVRVLDKSRFERKIGELSLEEFGSIKKRLQELMFL